MSCTQSVVLRKEGEKKKRLTNVQALDDVNVGDFQ